VVHPFAARVDSLDSYASRASLAKCHVHDKHPYLKFDLGAKQLPIPGPPSEQVILNRLASGHILCGEYYQKVNWDHSKGCVCGANIQTIEHVLWECQKCDQKRISAEMDKWSKNRELIMNYKEGRAALIEFIRSLKSFIGLEEE
jgi:hypothetical protein